MSTGLDRGRGGAGGREFFLSAHRCPEVDLLPHHDSGTHIHPPCSQVPAEKSTEHSCTSQSEANYLEVSSTCNSEEDEEEGSISDWSEEDLSLHFSPSVILPSDDEDSGPESSFECVDVTVEMLVKDQERQGLRMVPKRQIQLKKRKEGEGPIKKESAEKSQVTMKDGPAEGGGANCQVSTSELLCPTVRHRPDLLLRQHSMPTSLQTCSTTGSDGDSYRVYRGLVAGASKGFPDGKATRQRLQKSFSLDETKTKMASCIIKSVLSKKMQVEKNNLKTSCQQKKYAMLPDPPEPADQQWVKEGGGGETSCPMGKTGVFKGPVHVVRDMRSVVKNTYNLFFSSAPPEDKAASFKVIGQDDSPPPTYQQAVGVKGHGETRKGCQDSADSRRHVARVTASLSQSHDREQSNTHQKQGSEPVISRSKVNDISRSDPPTKLPVGSDLLDHSQSESDSVMTPHPIHSSFTQPPSQPPSTPRHSQGTQPPLLAQKQRSTPGVPSQFAPSSLRPSSFYANAGLPAFPSTMHPHLRRVSYLHSPVSHIQTQVQPQPPTPSLHLLRGTGKNQNESTVNTLDQPDPTLKTCLAQQSKTAEDQKSDDSTAISATHEPQQFLGSVQGFLPTQVGREFLVDMRASASAPDALVSAPTPCHVMLDPKSGQWFYVNMPPQPQTKMLLDPETGQYVQVFLPAASSTPSANILPLCCANPAPNMTNPAHSAQNPSQAVINPAPTVVSVMQLQPTVAMSSLYTPLCIPFFTTFR